MSGFGFSLFLPAPMIDVHYFDMNQEYERKQQQELTRLEALEERKRQKKEQ